MKIDYSRTEAPAGVEPGEYEVVVCAWDTKVSTNGNPMVVLDYEVRGDVQQDFAGAKVKFDSFTFTENAAWKMSAAAMAAGIPDGYELNDPEDFGRAMFHRSLIILTDYRDYNGKKYVSVKGYEASTHPIQQPPLPQPASNQWQQAPQPSQGGWGQPQSRQPQQGWQQGYGQPRTGAQYRPDPVNDTELPFN